VHQESRAHGAHRQTTYYVTESSVAELVQPLEPAAPAGTGAGVGRPHKMKLGLPDGRHVQMPVLKETDCTPHRVWHVWLSVMPSEGQVRGVEAKLPIGGLVPAVHRVNVTLESEESMHWHAPLTIAACHLVVASWHLGEHVVLVTPMDAHVRDPLLDVVCDVGERVGERVGWRVVERVVLQMVKPAPTTLRSEDHVMLVP
jgi:hypothetical protein